MLLVDDDALFLESLGLALARDPALDVVGRAANGLEAVRLVDALWPDVVTMDLDMPVVDGVQATRVIAERHPDVCVVTVTACASPERVEEARRAGAAGHVEKTRAADELPAAIHSACPNGTARRAA